MDDSYAHSPVRRLWLEAKKSAPKALKAHFSRWFDYLRFDWGKANMNLYSFPCG